MTRIILAILLIFLSLGLSAQELMVDSMYFDIEDRIPRDIPKKKVELGSYESGNNGRLVHVRTNDKRRREFVKLWVRVNGQWRLIYNEAFYLDCCLMGFTYYEPLIARAAYNPGDGMMYIFVQFSSTFNLYRCTLDGSIIPQRIDFSLSVIHACKSTYRRFRSVDMIIEDNKLKFRCILNSYLNTELDLSYDFKTGEWYHSESTDEWIQKKNYDHY